jgi:zinc protease
MLSRGTTKFTREQLADEFDKLKVSGRVSGPGASIQTTRENLDAALALVVHVLREPSFPESEFEQLRNQTITGIRRRCRSPRRSRPTRSAAFQPLSARATGAIRRPSRKRSRRRSP